MREIWKDIDDFSGWYQISSLGRVKSVGRYIRTKTRQLYLKEKILTPYLNSNGYYRITLSKNGKETKKYIHQLVASAFVNNPFNKPHVNHINNIHTDNSVSNLEWVTHGENIKHYWDNFEVKGHRETIGMMGKKVLDENRKRNIVNQIDPITLKIIATYPSVLEAERKTGIENSTIHRVIHGQRNNAGGYIWEKVNE